MSIGEVIGPPNWYLVNLLMIMEESWFKYGLLPVGTLVAGAVVKSLCRSHEKQWSKEDFAWGPLLVTSACLMMLLVMADRSHDLLHTLSEPYWLRDHYLPERMSKVASAASVFCVDLGVLILLTIWIRKKGWEEPDRLHSWKGFFGPWLVGLLCVELSFIYGVL
jgi:hypothetical protein